MATERGWLFLSGVETSAAMIASDFLIQELDRIAASTSRSEEEVALVPQMDDETAAIFGGGSMGVDKFAW